MCGATLKPPHLQKRGQHGGGRLLRKGLTLIYCIFLTCLVLAHDSRNGPLYLLLTTHVF